MKVDGRLDATTIGGVATAARRQESAGYRTLWTSETAHDPLLPLMPAAEHTTHVGLGCAITVALARSPMTLAHQVHDLQAYTGGRFTLGLGTQVRAHIERRFSMPWSHPAERVEEFVAALRTILSCWEQGEPLRFTGRYYTHTLMTPFFSPAPHGHGLPRIFLASVGTRMARAAGTVADGLFAHSFTTPAYLAERILPAVGDGLRRAGRDPSGFELNCRGFVVAGRDRQELTAAREAVRQQLAFYASTPAYRPVLAFHGWEALGEQLHALSVTRDPERWRRMADLVGDDVLDAFAVTGDPGDPAGLAARIAERYAGVAGSYRFYTPYRVDPVLLDEVAAALADPGTGRPLPS